MTRKEAEEMRCEFQGVEEAMTSQNLNSMTYEVLSHGLL